MGPVLPARTVVQQIAPKNRQPNAEAH
jgi:hypothetical protein